MHRRATASAKLYLGHPMNSWTLPLSRIGVLGALCGDEPDTLLLLLFALDEAEGDSSGAVD